MRCLYASVADWPRLYKQAYKLVFFKSKVFVRSDENGLTKISHLKPGGWIEQYEISVTFQSDDGTVKPDSSMVKFNKAWPTVLPHMIIFN